MVEEYTEISTKSGDKGSSSNFNGRCIQKPDNLFEAIGAIDELASHLGYIKWDSVERCHLEKIQGDLQKIMSTIATDPEPDIDAVGFVPRSDLYLNLDKIDSRDIDYLEEQEKLSLPLAKIEPTFVLSGDKGKVSAYLDICRSVCRRAERVLIRYAEQEFRGDLEYCRAYLNRLSDLLFIYARIGR